MGGGKEQGSEGGSEGRVACVTGNTEGHVIPLRFGNTCVTPATIETLCSDGDEGKEGERGEREGEGGEGRVG